MTSRRGSLSLFNGLNDEVAPISQSRRRQSGTIDSEPVPKSIDARSVVDDVDLFSEFQQRLRQSKHNVTTLNTRQLFQEFLLEKKKLTATASSNDESLSSVENDRSSSRSLLSRQVFESETDKEVQPNSLVEAAANTTATAKKFFRRMSMVSTASSQNSSRSLTGSERSARPIEEDDDSFSFMSQYSTSPGRLNVLQFGSSARRHSETEHLPSKSVASQRCIYQMAQETCAAADNLLQRGQDNETQKAHPQVARRGSLLAMTDRLSQVATFAKSSLDNEVDDDFDESCNAVGGVFSGP